MKTAHYDEMSATLTGESLPGAVTSEAAFVRSVVHVPDHTLLRVIGRGSYGEVWEARNIMGASRAVKIVRRQDFDDARPFEREFEGIQRYEPVSRTHAGLVQVLHVGMASGGDHFYYVMELADDRTATETNPDTPSSILDYKPKTLSSEIRRRKALPVEGCIDIGMNLASALGHLHKSGLVHRDVKPSNIIFVNGVLKLADVGLVAKLSDTRSLVGTEGYFAPEGTARPGSDVYSLGKVLYECVTGLDRLQFPDVPNEWGADAPGRAAFEFMEIVLRAAEPNPARRYESTEEMLADLALLQAGKSVRNLRRMEKRLKQTVQFLTVAILIISFAGGAWLYERHRRERVEDAQQDARHAQSVVKKLLGESLVAEARAVRLNGQAGARNMALRAVERGRIANAPTARLRTEAASALALTDVGPFSQPVPDEHPPGTVTVWSDDGEYLATFQPGGKTGVFKRSLTFTDEIAAFAAPSGAEEIALSHKARWLAIAYRQSRLVLWDVEQGRLGWEMDTAPHTPAVAFSSDGDWLVCSTPGGIVARTCEGSIETTLVPGAPAVRRLLLAPDGTWMATLDAESNELGFRIYTGLPGRIPTKDDLAALKVSAIGSEIRLNGPSISGDSRYLAASVAEDGLRVWDVRTLKEVAWLRGHQRNVRGTAFHPSDSALIASTSWDGTTRLWDIPTRREVLVAPTGGEQILMLPGRGEFLLRSWDRGFVRVAAMSRCRGFRVLTLPPETRLGLFSSVDFSPDGRLLAAAGDAGVIVWDLEAGNHHILHRSGPDVWRDARFAPGGTALWCSGSLGLRRHMIKREASGAEIFAAQDEIDNRPHGHIQWVGDKLAASFHSGGQRGAVRIIGAGGQDSRQLDLPFVPDRLAASSDGRWLAATRYPHAGGLVWDLASNPTEAMPVTSSGRADFGFLTHFPNVIAIGTDQNVSFETLPGCPARPEDRLQPFARVHAEIVPGRIAETNNGDLAAFGTSPTGITLCDGRTLEQIATLDSPLTPFDCVLAFSDDGSRLALAGGVSRVVIWEIAWLKRELEAFQLGW